jgi:alpha-glucan, water dikinase
MAFPSNALQMLYAVCGDCACALQGITGPAQHLQFLIPAVQHLLWVLKVTHSGSDLDTAMSFARGAMPGDLQWDVDDLLRNRDEWWVPGKIVNIRERLSPCWRGADASAARSLLLLDISLDTFFRTRVEGTNVDQLSGDDALGLLELVLNAHCISAGCTPEAAAAAAGLRKLMHEPPAGLERWGQDWGMHAVAVLDNVALAVQHTLDSLASLTQLPADIFGEKVPSVDAKYVANFGEEVARGHPLYVSSALLGKLQREARSAAGLGPWEVISAGPAAPAAGEALVNALSEMQVRLHSIRQSVVLQRMQRWVL